MKKMEFNVEGMHCRSCGTIIEENLKDIGVNDVKVLVDKGKVVVSLKDDSISADKIRQAIEKDGYKVKK